MLAWLGVVTALLSVDVGADTNAAWPEPPPALPGADISPLPSGLSTDEFRPIVRHPYLYTALETTLALTAGTIWYLRHGTDESWRAAFEFRTWKRKLIGEDVDFDGDHFNTNAAGHPIGGAGYYQIARGNGLGPGAAFITSALASTFWEYFVELPEHPSINDLIMTPVGGAVIGEATYRLGRYLAVSGSGSVRCAAAFVFAPVAMINDRLHCRRRDEVLPSARLELSLGFNRVAFDSGMTRNEVALGFGSDIVTKRVYQRAGEGGVAVGPGQWAGFNADLLLGENNLEGAWFNARTVWAGRYQRHYRSMTDETDLPEVGGPPQGWGWLLGMGSSFDYRLRDLPTVHDRIASVGLLGPAFELSARNGAIMRATFNLQYAFALVGSMAYRADPMSLADNVIKTELRNFGYYYAQGVVSAATLMFDLGPIGFSGDARGGWYWSINAGDPSQSTIQRDILLHDTRFYLTTSMWTRPLVGAARFGLSYQQIWRHSNMLGATIAENESDLLATTALIF